MVKKVVESTQKELRDKGLARIEYARQLYEYMQRSNMEVSFEVTTRSMKSKYIINANDILLVRYGLEDRRASQLAKGFLDIADAAKLKQLQFAYLLVGGNEGGSYRAYDVDKGEWVPKSVSFCPPALECTLYIQQ